MGVFDTNYIGDHNSSTPQNVKRKLFEHQIVFVFLYNHQFCFGCSKESSQHNYGVIVFLFGLMFYVTVNSYGYVEMVSSPYYNFFLGKLDLKQITSTSCTHL